MSRLPCLCCCVYVHVIPRQNIVLNYRGLADSQFAWRVRNEQRMSVSSRGISRIDLRGGVSIMSNQFLSGGSKDTRSPR